MRDVVDSLLRVRLRIMEEDREALRTLGRIHPLDLRRNAGRRVRARVFDGQIGTVLKPRNHHHQRRSGRRPAFLLPLVLLRKSNTPKQDEGDTKQVPCHSHCSFLVIVPSKSSYQVYAESMGTSEAGEGGATLQAF